MTRILSAVLLSALFAATVATVTPHCAVRPRQYVPGSPVRAGLGPFTYDDGPTGPKSWGNIKCPGYSLCSTGAYQSPINVQTALTWTPKCALNLVLKERSAAPMRYRVAANDFSYACEDDVNGCGWMSYRNKAYKMIQLHMHSPSEHALDGRRTQMEIHFVHQHPMDKSLAVLGAFIKQGAFNPALENLMAAARKRGLVNVDIKTLIAPVAARPRPCTWRGSLTTPPCTEGVKWILSNTFLFASREQIVEFRTMNGGLSNNRPLQSAQGRSIRCFLDAPRVGARPCTEKDY